MPLQTIFVNLNLQKKNDGIELLAPPRKRQFRKNWDSCSYEQGAKFKSGVGQESYRQRMEKRKREIILTMLAQESFSPENGPQREETPCRLSARRSRQKHRLGGKAGLNVKLGSIPVGQPGALNLNNDTSPSHLQVAERSTRS